MKDLWLQLTSSIQTIYMLLRYGYDDSMRQIRKEQLRLSRAIKENKKQKEE